MNAPAPDLDGFLARFFAFGAAPSVDTYLPLFHPDATLFDSGMAAPLTVREIPAHIASTLALLGEFRMTPERWRLGGRTCFVEARNEAIVGGSPAFWRSVYCVDLAGDRVIRGRRYYDRQPLFARLRRELAHDPAGVGEETWTATMMLDHLGLYTTDVFLKTREEAITRQQAEMLELSTPVVKLWEGILALPMIGTLDSARTQVVMETLLQRIVEIGADVAIIDITGVPTVDTLVAQHLLKTVTAARLMGADCIISGIRPQIAQTIVHLGVDLGDVITKATLADAFAVALQRRGLAVGRAAARS